MKKFIIQLLYFIIPFVLLPSFFISHYGFLDEDILNSELERKISTLKIDTAKINIIIAGDSRAERQLIPEIIKTNTGFNTINIATSSCDLVTVVSAIKKKYQYCSKILFVISASSWQVNDGAIDPGYLSLKCFQKLNTREKIVMFRKSLPEMIKLQLVLFKHVVKKVLHKENDINIDGKKINEFGFLGIDGIFKVEKKNILEAGFVKHTWYKNNNNNGFRWTIFQKSLGEIENMNSFFIIYQPPISSYWRINTAKSFIDIAEIEYSKKLASEIQDSKNIVFFDFYSNEISELNDSMYYDYQHLNRQGAEVFSLMLSKKILTVYQNKIMK
jgi:hypothetical protein